VGGNVVASAAVVTGPAVEVVDADVVVVAGGGGAVVSSDVSPSDDPHADTINGMDAIAPAVLNCRRQVHRLWFPMVCVDLLQILAESGLSACRR
jgi:hypothetical protein